MSDDPQMTLGSALLFAALCVHVLATSAQAPARASWSLADEDLGCIAASAPREPAGGGRGYLDVLSYELIASAGGEGAPLPWGEEGEGVPSQRGTRADCR